MKKILTCIVYLFTTQILNAQPFGANNATWHFSIYNILFNTIDPVTVTSSASFVFMGDTCYSLSSNNTGCMTVNPFTVKESNDSVYYYNTASNSFVLLYNYNAMVGDTQTIYVPDFSGTNLSIQMVVTSTSTILVNGVSKKLIASHTLIHPFTTLILKVQSLRILATLPSYFLNMVFATHRYMDSVVLKIHL